MSRVTTATITDAQILALFAKHCECRPLDVDRRSHSHDCDTDITDTCRVALGGRPDGQLYPRSTVEALVQTQAARARCAEHLNNAEGHAMTAGCWQCDLDIPHTCYHGLPNARWGLTDEAIEQARRHLNSHPRRPPRQPRRRRTP